VTDAVALGAGLASTGRGWRLFRPDPPGSGITHRRYLMGKITTRDGTEIFYKD
jgi:hypothetical protein